eukprot:TRINITY_DN2780_c0_g1_i1.p2 TRINITY_DN2780_c0_g1~~TRINITY_DN2780_c0_g1_i1.p2  ORF type:complete len:160 (+),score=20.07 TRINITY_DN2780_c0_g1_i1:93-572(+)
MCIRDRLQIIKTTPTQNKINPLKIIIKKIIKKKSQFPNKKTIMQIKIIYCFNKQIIPSESQQKAQNKRDQFMVQKSFNGPTEDTPAQPVIQQQNSSKEENSKKHHDLFEASDTSSSKLGGQRTNQICENNQLVLETIGKDFQQQLPAITLENGAIYNGQ